MKVKKYVAPTMPEAMKKIRAELGRDAVILNSKIVYKGGFFGLFRKKNIEVIAAVDQTVQLHEKKPLDFRDYPMIDKEMREKETIIKETPTPEAAIEQKVEKKIENEKPNDEIRLLQEIQELKKMITSISKNEHAKPTMHAIPKPYTAIYERLIHQEISQEILDGLVEAILENYYGNKGNVSDEEAENFVYQHLYRLLSVYPLGGITLQKKFINVIGPTGVGKTTTLAKMAAHSAINLHKRIAFITTDTFRIGAVEQLKTYAKILNAPVEVCYNKTDFRRAVHLFSHYDLVFIDTAGRNFLNEQYVKELQNTIDYEDNMETYLVFSLTGKETDMDDIYSQFSSIPIDKFIFTKLDETSYFGSILNLSLKYNKGIAYITNGQDVPDDIVEASPKWIIEKIIGVEVNE
ncbi:flagellar biosynthesis protein FlhF [Caldibacillus lycopersici]|uniref:Flagellar biosynthesis protein FlhF n=1 Tax=Perspicuibacillus lycopersici TaxID=1325689 RepID=A0AAE3LLM3_9BACI|nr:flagellar biosynthesis protein FlhF [Perspicuibacillus lycopersici]MCU9612086.1 flagellar biosynthesis protein FlhF [Perspicuibacillus lycopersici]